MAFSCAGSLIIKKRKSHWGENSFKFAQEVGKLQAGLDILSKMFNVLFIASIINMLTNNKSAKLSLAELFEMNQLLFFL